MEDWKIAKIKEAVSGLQKEELRRFAVAYSELDEKYHGYLQTVQQTTKVWWEQADPDTMKALQKEFGWDKIGQWDNKGKWSVYYKSIVPYLGIDGHIAIFADKHPDFSITTEVIQVGNRLLAKASITTGKWTDGSSASTWEGTAEIKDGESVDVPVATSIRKALTYTGDGRFPIHTTPYKDHDLVLKFKEFLEKQKNG